MRDAARDPAALELLRVQRSRLADRMRPSWWYLTGIAIMWALVFAGPFGSGYLPRGGGPPAAPPAGDPRGPARRRRADVTARPDPLIHPITRLSICGLLAAGADWVEFAALRDAAGISDSVLSKQSRV